jgi:hypothetical protein
VMVAVDPSRPMYVRRDQQALEQRVVERAARMVAVKDKRFNTDAFERALSRFENQVGYSLTLEQRQLVHAIASNRFAWANGEAGSGKTTSMRATKAVAAELGVPIIGLATSKAAAKKLEAETGIPSYTLARAMFGTRPVIEPGAWVIVDESSMSSYKALDAIGALIERRGGGSEYIVLDDESHLLLGAICDLRRTCRRALRRRSDTAVRWSSQRSASIFAVGVRTRRSGKTIHPSSTSPNMRASGSLMCAGGRART